MHRSSMHGRPAQTFLHRAHSSGFAKRNRLTKGQRWGTPFSRGAIVKPYKSMAERFEQFTIPEPNSGCFLWLGSVSQGGYGLLQHGGRKGKHFQAHRAAWEMKNGEIPDGLWVLHKCDTPSCVNPDHLFLGTYLDNVRDMVRKGRNSAGIGIANGGAKLTEEQVLSVMPRIRDGETLASIARYFGVGLTAIYNISAGKRWRHLKAAA